ncbi:MAG: hypothetical protein L0Y71_21020 [Gemmataceae bacterium]|nr:hypothetical protein [Gemmataceae bacterium]
MFILKFFEVSYENVSAEPPSMHRYHQVLMDVEAELLDKHRLNVWLIPTLPE